MWKWVAVSALIYGLLAMQIAGSPRMLKAQQALDLAALGQLLGGRPELPAFWDFESPGLPVITRPESPHELAVWPDGNHVLRWRPPSGDAPLYALALPLRHVPELPPELHIAIRAEGIQAVLIGLREDDGSVYGLPQPVSTEWRGHLLPCDRFKLILRTEDENAALDIDQVTSVVIAIAGGELRGRLERPGERRREEKPEAPLVVELDDVGFRAQSTLKPPPAVKPDAGPPHDGKPPNGPPPAKRRAGEQPPAGRPPRVAPEPQ